MMSTFLRKSQMIAVWGLIGLMMTAQSQTLPTGKNIATGSKWNGTDKSFVETLPPAGPVRSIAEFERSAGVLISYPRCIPMELVIELSQDDTVYTIVANESEKAIAVSEYTAAGVNMSHFSPFVSSSFLSRLPFFGQKIFFVRGKKHLLILFLLRSFWVSLTRANYYISAPFCLLSWEGVLFFGGCFFLSNRLRKDFERFVCKEKRRTFVTAKAIAARFGEELFRRARRDSFLGGIRRRAFS